MDGKQMLKDCGEMRGHVLAAMRGVDDLERILAGAAGQVDEPTSSSVAERGEGQ
ncbi:hypothetical protein IGS73_14710 [Janibacter indicus]|uniref:Uncharacterized protein n=1 Tax=Janibacter indicus TaxID=857417 RepID=A0A7L9IZ96_9MICO|nr:hypothetical protein [Janibacter indicus]QOK22322.1 hypothetical protein IGS73_14710 [Janibacter indicus]